MELKKINELLNLQSEIYFFSEFNSHLITNKMYEAIDLFDADLKVQKTIRLPSSFTVDNVFFKPEATEFALYDSDENMLVFCDINANNTHIVSLEERKLPTLSSRYSWRNNILAIVCKNNAIVLVDSNKIPVLYPEAEIKEPYLDLYKFSRYINLFYMVFQVSFENKTFICVDEENQKIIFDDLKNKATYEIFEPEIKYHDIIFLDNFFAIISEDEVVVKDHDNSISILSNEGECFLRAAFIRTDKLYLYLLISNKSDRSISSIAQYELTKN